MPGGGGNGFRGPREYSTYLLHNKGITYVGITAAWRYKTRMREHRHWTHKQPCSSKIFEGVFTHMILETKWCETVEEYKEHERLSMSYFTHTNCNMVVPCITDEEKKEARRLSQKRSNKKYMSKPGSREKKAKDAIAWRKAKTNFVVEKAKRGLRTRGFTCQRLLNKLHTELRTLFYN